MNFTSMEYFIAVAQERSFTRAAERLHITQQTLSAHIAGIDRELKLWGDHAIAGTEGAEVIPELKLSDKDYVVPKRRYSGFFQTDLDILLRELGVQTVVMTGLHAHMCVRHTSADAFSLGYDVVVAKQATDSFTEEDYLNGLAYLKTCYGADAYSNEELIAMF